MSPFSLPTYCAGAVRAGKSRIAVDTACWIAAGSTLPLVILPAMLPCQTSAFFAVSIAWMTSVPSVKLRTLGLPTPTDPPMLLP